MTYYIETMTYYIETMTYYIETMTYYIETMTYYIETMTYYIETLHNAHRVRDLANASHPFQESCILCSIAQHRVRIMYRSPCDHATQKEKENFEIPAQP
jgi:hypothetical protein